MTVEATRPGIGADPRPIWLAIRFIEIGENRRAIIEESLPGLMGSITAFGVRTPITVRFNADKTGYILVTGRHLVEACIRLGIWEIRGHVQTEWDTDECRMWEISENLHRAGLRELEHGLQIVEWIALVERRDKVGQLAPVSGGRGNVGGDRLAARELNISRDQVRRAKAVAGLPPEAKAAARELRLDDNQSALVEAAKADDPVAALRERGGA